MMLPEESGATPEETALRKELNSAYRKLAESYKMATVGRLMAGIAHEMSTPIGSIFTNNAVSTRSLETLESLLAGGSAADLEKAREIVGVLKTLAGVDKIACERISSVIPGLKTFARMDETELRSADVNEILRSTIALTRCEFRARITLETDFGELPKVQCYPQSLHQVFLNVMINAAQAIDGQGTIRVRSRHDDGFVHVSISDTGRGVRPEDVPKIFTPGFTTKPMGVGTGLGLAMSRQIVVERHGGTIEFESEVGTGTTFHIRIPVAGERPARSKE